VHAYFDQLRPEITGVTDGLKQATNGYKGVNDRVSNLHIRYFDWLEEIASEFVLVFNFNV